MSRPLFSIMMHSKDARLAGIALDVACEDVGLPPPRRPRHPDSQTKEGPL